jgi:hypothetical protein
MPNSGHKVAFSNTIHDRSRRLCLPATLPQHPSSTLSARFRHSSHCVMSIIPLPYCLALFLELSAHQPRAHQPAAPTKHLRIPTQRQRQHHDTPSAAHQRDHGPPQATRAFKAPALPSHSKTRSYSSSTHSLVHRLQPILPIPALHRARLPQPAPTVPHLLNAPLHPRHHRRRGLGDRYVTAGPHAIRRGRVGGD